jgi:hypothetical protein
LGNDIIKGNLIIDRSEKLKFADSTIPPVDIKYRSHAKLGSTLTKTILGPRQSALIALTITALSNLSIPATKLTPTDKLPF